MTEFETKAKEMCEYIIQHYEADIIYQSDPFEYCYKLAKATMKVSPFEARVMPVAYGTCKDCIFNLEESETSLSSKCQLTVDEFTGIGLQFSRDFGCNQWQSKPSV